MPSGYTSSGRDGVGWVRDGWAVHRWWFVAMCSGGAVCAAATVAGTVIMLTDAPPPPAVWIVAAGYALIELSRRRHDADAAIETTASCPTQSPLASAEAAGKSGPH